MKLKILLLIITFTFSSFAGELSEEIIRSDSDLAKIRSLINEEKNVSTNWLMKNRKPQAN